MVVVGARLGCGVESFGIHSFVRQHTYLLATQVRDEVDPISIRSFGPHAADCLRIESELSTNLQTPWGQGMGFRSA